jgi:hypothetical protein
MPMKTALVPVESIASDRPVPPAGRRANADFIAHLIAMAQQAPQTRARRRADPQEALAAYRALGHWPSEPGGTLSRSF